MGFLYTEIVDVVLLFDGDRKLQKWQFINGFNYKLSFACKLMMPSVPIYSRINIIVSLSKPHSSKIPIITQIRQLIKLY